MGVLEWLVDNKLLGQERSVSKELAKPHRLQRFQQSNLEPAWIVFHELQKIRQSLEKEEQKIVSTKPWNQFSSRNQKMPV